jgi:hypothetical protein
MVMRFAAMAPVRNLLYAYRLVLSPPDLVVLNTMSQQRKPENRIALRRD